MALFTPPCRLVALVLVAAACHAASPFSPPATDTARIRQDVAFLASDALEGRGTGTRGNDTAAAFIARRFAALGLTAPETGFLQTFDARSAAAAHQGVAASLRTQNVVAFVPGHDRNVRGQYIVLGAHFDHLGRGTFGALDAHGGGRDAIRNGADDNASGTAAILELARLLRANPPRRSVAIVAFSGEELGLLGSGHFVANPPAPLVTDSVYAMLNFDMVGRVRNERLLVFGTATASEWPAVLAAANSPTPFALALVGDGFGPSDHSSFFARNIPVLHFFSDTHDDYHRATDDVDRINVAGLARVVRFSEGIVRHIANRDGRLTFVAAAAAARPGPRASSQAYLGSVPDMAAGDRPGLRLSGVTPGSPADRGGLKTGDLVVSLGGREVTDLTTYSDALYAHGPGDEVVIVVLRGSERLTFRVTLGRRGQ
ncbi:MAG: M28 family peptidase [Gemmatimonadaceae bacterium]